MTSDFLQFTVIIHMAQKRAKCDRNGLKMAFFFATKLQNLTSSSGALPLTLSVIRLSCIGLFSIGPKLGNFCAKKLDLFCAKKLDLVQVPSLLAKF